MPAMMTLRRIAVLLLAVCSAVATPLSSGQAQESEKAFYAGKTVRMIVGSGVGGGYDVFSRLIAREGERIGVSARTNAMLTDIVKKVERGELKPDPKHITELRLN